MSRKTQFPFQRKRLFLSIMGFTISLATVVTLVGFYHTSDEEKYSGITNQILSYSGYSRVIEQEEFDFYNHLARREVDDYHNNELLDESTKAVIQTANAQFYLGNKLGLYGPYSFVNLQEQMKLENTKRRIDKENGKAIYGPEQFDIYSYYQYVSSNLEVEIIDYLAANADEAMLTKARTYFRENIEVYDHPEQIVYSLTENGYTEEHSIDWGQLNSLENSDSTLAQILRAGHVGQEFSYSFGDIQRTGIIQAIKGSKTDFEQQIMAIKSDFLKSGYYRELLQEVGNNNPVAYAEK